MNSTTPTKINEDLTFSIEDFPEDVKLALKQANDYFDKNPPKSSTQEEIDEFLKQFK